MNWECDRCGQIHRANPPGCSACGHTVLSPTRNEPQRTRHPLRLAVAGTLFLGVLLVLAVVGWPTLTATDGYAVLTGSLGEAEAMDESALERLVHLKINERRADHGLSPLTYDTELAAVARYYSERMDREAFFAHEAPDGETFQDRYEQFGYDCTLRVNDSHVLKGGENLARTHYDEAVRTSEDEIITHKTLDGLAEGIVTGWMNSPSHRENLLKPEWEREGIGVYVNPDGTVHATQNFC